MLLEAAHFLVIGVIMDNNTIYEWILPMFSVSARAKSIHCMEPYLSPLVRHDYKVLDLCCGSGPSSFWFEERGAKVTGIDSASYMIALARKEATHRNSSVEFVEADIFTYPVRREHYDLVCCFGNSICDIPLYDFPRMVRQVITALKPKGRFVLQYHDGCYEYMQGSVARQGIYQENPEQITFRFKEYLPEIGAYVKIITNQKRGEEYERKGYIYTVPIVRIAIGDAMELENHITLSENHFLDVFVKTSKA
jgi:SAM-dependent methyltransferase